MMPVIVGLGNGLSPPLRTLKKSFTYKGTNFG